MKVDVIAADPGAAHMAVQEVWRVAKTLTMDGKPVHIVAAEYEQDRSLEQNRWYWGVFLKTVSDQARIGGARYSVEAWHELGKRQFLGFTVSKVSVAGRKKSTVIRRLKSTRDLTVRQMAKYLEEFQAFAVADLGVAFPENPNDRRNG